MSMTSEKKDRKKTPKGQRKDHYVPEAYQKNFVTSKGTVFVWNKESRSIAEKYPAQLCWKDHYYEVTPELLNQFNQNDPKVIEAKAFKAYEDNVQDLSSYLLAHNEHIESALFLKFCHGYLLQKQRVPSHEKGLADIDLTHKPFHAKVAMEDLRRQFNGANKDDPNVPGYLFEDKYWNDLLQEAIDRPTVHHHTQLQGLLATATGSNFPMNDALERLAGMQLTVLSCPRGHTFFYSDNPGFSIIENPNNPDTLVAVNTHFKYMIGINFPINANQAIYVHRGEEQNWKNQLKPVQYLDLSVDDVIQFNFQTIELADKHVMCIDKDYLQAYVNNIGNHNE